MKSIYENKNIIGSDETGVGDYLTPLVAAAVFVPINNVRKLEALGITDSKKLTDSKITELYNEMKTMIKSSVRKMSQRQYNFLNKKYNANELKMRLHLECIASVESRVDNIDLVIIDQFSTAPSLDKYRKRIIEEENKDSEKEWLDIQAETKYVTKGEMEHVSVAAASIVARAYFIHLMEEQNKKWDIKFPLGTNKEVVAFAQRFVAKNGKDSLYDVAKLSFKTTKEVLND